jgi:hypothetical protein
MQPRKPRIDARPALASRSEDQPEGLRLYVDPMRLNTAELDYTWIRSDILGAEDVSAKNDAIRRGYTPVKWSDIGGGQPTWPGETPKDDWVRDAGTILCQRPKHLAEREKERDRLETENQMKNTIRDLREFEKVGDPRYLQRAQDSGVKDLGMQTGVAQRDAGRFADA